MTGISDERVLGKIIHLMNAHLPSKRIRLRDLLQMAAPHYTSRDKQEYVLDRKELELIKGIVDSHSLGDVKLPIMLWSETGQDHAMWRVEGETEVAIIQQILDRERSGPRDKMFLYFAHLSIVRKMLPTTTVPVFAL